MTKTEIFPVPIDLRSHFEQALAQIAEAIIAIDGEGRVQYINAAAEKIIGCSAKGAIAQPLSTVLSIVDVVSGADFSEAIDAAHNAVDTTRGYRSALLLRCEEHPIVIEYCVTAVRRGAAQAGSVIVFRDLMKLRNSEQALHEERERARVTLNSIGDAVVSTDFRGRVTFINAIAELLTGWTLKGASGRPLDEVLPLFDSQSRARVPCPAMKAIIEDDICRSGATDVLVRPDGSEIAVEHSASPIHDSSGGVIGVVVVAHDVTAARNQADGLARQALYDSLTDLPNRTLLADRLAHALHGAQRNGRAVAILFVDLDRFKVVNDTDGHAVGDRLLHQVAHRLLACVRSTDTVSRHGGDEFVILLPDVHSGADAAVCGGNIVAALNQPFEIDGHRCHIGASVGIASQPSSSGDMLLKHADIAMYHAKSMGRSRVSVFSPEMIYDSEHYLATHSSG